MIHRLYWPLLYTNKSYIRHIIGESTGFLLHSLEAGYRSGIFSSIGMTAHHCGVLKMTEILKPDQEKQASAPSALPFRTLLYRFMFFDWLFRDVSMARNRFERHAALQHNKYMSRYLPVYLRRWSVLATFDFGMGFLFERGLQATAWAACFFTWSCMTVTGMVVIAVAWLLLPYGRFS